GTVRRGRRTEPYPPVVNARRFREGRSDSRSHRTWMRAMNFGFESSVKGIQNDARRTAEEAARRAGLPLNDWLNAGILQQGAKLGLRPSPQTHFEEERPSEKLSEVQLRLDDLGRRLDQITRTGFAPKRSRDETDPLVEQFARLEQRIEQLASNITRSPEA